MGVDVVFARKPIAVKLTKLNGDSKLPGSIRGEGNRFSFDYAGADSAIAINRILKAGAQADIVLFSANDKPRISGSGASRDLLQSLSRDLGLDIQLSPDTNSRRSLVDKALPLSSVRVRTPRSEKRNCRGQPPGD